MPPNTAVTHDPVLIPLISVILMSFPAAVFPPPLASHLRLRSVMGGSSVSLSRSCFQLAASGKHRSSTKVLKQAGGFGNCFCKGRLCTSAPTESCREMPVTDGNGAGCAAVSSVFRLAHLHANYTKIIFSIGALERKTNTNTQCQPAGMSLLHRTALRRAHSLQEERTRGSVDSASCPLTAPCMVLRAKAPMKAIAWQSAAILTPQNRSVKYVRNKGQVHPSQCASGAVENHP